MALDVRNLNFLAAAESWTVEHFAGWLRDGIASYADDSRGDSWVTSFPPLLLDHHRDPANQISAVFLDLRQRSERAYQRACSAVGQLITHLAWESTVGYVVPLLKLATTANPPGVVQSVRKHLEAIARIQPVGEWRRVMNILVDMVADTRTDAETIQFLENLYGTTWWEPYYCAPLILATIRTDASQWPTLKTRLGSDLGWLDDNDPDLYTQVCDAVESIPRRPAREGLSEATVNRIDGEEMQADVGSSYDLSLSGIPPPRVVLLAVLNATEPASVRPKARR